MRFGGHETFHIREGWLHKALDLLVECPERLVDEHSADWLGVGRNMAKSIRHWLVATGLAAQGKQKSRNKSYLELTDFGKLVYENDPYFSELGTWWVLHIHLVNSPQAAAWAWFFNSFAQPRFEKSVCVESLRRNLSLSKSRIPRPKTLDRDIACLLSTYAKKIPADRIDPEDALDCPLLELGLISNFRNSGYYQVNQGAKEIPLQIFCYSLSVAFEEARGDQGFVDIPVEATSKKQGGPAKVFVMTRESLFEVVCRVEACATRKELEIAGLAGERVIRVRKRSPLTWLDKYYRSLRRRNSNAA